MFYYLHSFRVAMASRRRPLAPTQPTEDPPTRRAPELGPCTYVEVITPAFDPNRVLLRRVFFLNDDKSNYVSVGFYPAQNYQPLVEFGGAKPLPMVLTADYVATMAVRLPSLVEATCQNEQYQCRPDDKVFIMNTTGSYRDARVTLDKHSLSFKLHELRNLLYKFYVVRNQLFMYTEAMSDVQSYVNAAMASENYVEPAPSAHRSVVYRQLFEELKSPM